MRFEKKDFALLIPATLLAVAGLGPDDPFVVGPCLFLSWVSFIVICVIHEGSRRTRTVVGVVITVALFGVGYRRFNSIYRHATSETASKKDEPKSEIPSGPHTIDGVATMEAKPAPPIKGSTRKKELSAKEDSEPISKSDLIVELHADAKRIRDQWANYRDNEEWPLGERYEHLRKNGDQIASKSAKKEMDEARRRFNGEISASLKLAQKLQDQALQRIFPTPEDDHKRTEIQSVINNPEGYQGGDMPEYLVALAERLRSSLNE